MGVKSGALATLLGVLTVVIYYLILTNAERIETYTSAGHVLTGVLGIIIMAGMALLYGTAVMYILDMFGIKFEEHEGAE